MEKTRVTTIDCRDLLSLFDNKREVLILLCRMEKHCRVAPIQPALCDGLRDNCCNKGCDSLCDEKCDRFRQL